MIEVHLYQLADRTSWDAFVQASRTPHMLFERTFVEYHADRFVDASLVIVDDGKIVALLPASRHGREIRSHGGLTFGGFVTSSRMGGTRMLEVVRATMDHLKAEGIDRLIYKAVPHPYHVVPAEEDLYALARCGAVLHRRDLSSVIDLSASPRYSKGRSYDLRHAAVSLVVETSQDFDTWHAIETETLARHGVTPVHSANELRQLAAHFPDRLLLHVVRNGPAGPVIAVAVSFLTPAVWHVQYLGQSSTGRELGAMDVLVDALIHAASAADPSPRWFDLGISTEDDGRKLNSGLAAYKEGFGARAVCFDQYAIAP